MITTTVTCWRRTVTFDGKKKHSARIEERKRTGICSTDAGNGCQWQACVPSRLLGISEFPF